MTACGEKEAPGDSYAFTHVNVIPMDQERVLSLSNLILKNASGKGLALFLLNGGDGGGPHLCQPQK